MLHGHDLIATLDIINEAFLYGRPLSVAQREAFAEQIISRQEKPNPVAGAPVFTNGKGLDLFSGETLKTRFATRHILQEEAARALVLLTARTVDVREALERVNKSLAQACFAQSCVKGECAHAMIGLMHYLAAGGLGEPEKRLDIHLKTLSQHRNGSGDWGHFPFYYTLLALTEIDLPAAIQEMRYAAPACERRLRRVSSDDKISQRRRAIMQRVLSRC
jgi:hypothetical protein